MSVIAVKITKTKFIFGSDSLGDCNQVAYYDRSKVQGEFPFIYGFVGQYREISPLYQRFGEQWTGSNPNSKALQEILDEELQNTRTRLADHKYKWRCQGVFLLRDRLYMFLDGVLVRMKEDFAIGSGQKYAVAMLRNGNSMREAIESAMHNSKSCGGAPTVNIIERKPLNL